MANITGVRFRGTGKIYYFSPGELTLKIGDQVVVETAQGTEVGEIRMNPREIPDDQLRQPVKEIIRLATEDDLARVAKNREKEKEAFRICKQKIREHGLEMKLVDAEYTFDNNKLLFYFTADGRVDFRSLVRDLASVFHTRIELRQIGVRDETRILGGIGPCGRELCCKSWLTDFVPVSIKMAKEQNLSLNPTKISGVCGRLMCCLKNEEDTYEYLNKTMPRVGDIMRTAAGDEGYVQNINILRQTVRLVTEDGDTKDINEYPVDELTFVAHRGRHHGEPQNQQSESCQEGDGSPRRRGRGDSPSENRGESGRERGERRGGRQENQNREASSQDGQEQRENRQGRGRGDRRNLNRQQREGGERRGRQNQQRGERQEGQNQGGQGGRQGNRQQGDGTRKRQNQGNRQQNREGRQNPDNRQRENRGGRQRRGRSEQQGAGQQHESALQTSGPKAD